MEEKEFRTIEENKEITNESEAEKNKLKTKMEIERLLRDFEVALWTPIGKFGDKDCIGNRLWNFSKILGTESYIVATWDRYFIMDFTDGINRIGEIAKFAAIIGDVWKNDVMDHSTEELIEKHGEALKSQGDIYFLETMTEYKSDGCDCNLDRYFMLISNDPTHLEHLFVGLMNYVTNGEEYECICTELPKKLE